MKLFYRDPEKRKLQILELILAFVLLPIGSYGGYTAYLDWQSYKEAAAIYEQASVLLHTGKVRQAIPKLEQVVEIRPDYYAAWEELAVSYHMLKEMDKSVGTYERAVEALPENGNLHRELATAYHHTGKYQEALKHAQLAASLPNSDELFTARVLERAEREAKNGADKKPAAPPDLEALDKELHDHEGEAGHQHEEETSEHDKLD